jgi:hypothetical protein
LDTNLDFSGGARLLSVGIHCKRKINSTTYEDGGFSETRGKSLILLASSMLEIRSKLSCYAAVQNFADIVCYRHAAVLFKQEEYYI